jgi:hypothetical protein
MRCRDQVRKVCVCLIVGQTESYHRPLHSDTFIFAGSVNSTACVWRYSDIDNCSLILATNAPSDE